MGLLVNLARMATSTTGTGSPLTLTTAINGYLTFALAGVADGQTVSYGIRDGDNSEVGQGVYTAATKTLTRSVLKSTNANSPISLTSNAQVYVTALAEDIAAKVAKAGDTMTGALAITATTPSTSPITGALTVSGGFGVAGDIYCGGTINGTTLIPQNVQSAAYTTVLADGGKHILHPSTDTTARTFTIAGNATVPYPIGTAITFVNQNAAGVLTVAATDTMRLAGSGTIGSQTLAANSMATAIKIAATEWIISGTGGTYVAKSGDTMTGPLAISDTTASTSASTGALTVAGGVGIGNGLNVSQNIRSTFSGTQGNYYFGDGNTKYLWFDGTTYQLNGGKLAIADTTASSSPTTGALTVAGGLGVNSLIWSKGLNIDTGGDAYTVYNKAGVQKWLLGMDAANGDRFALIEPGVGYWLTIARTSGNVNIASTTASTSPSTGALTVAGGVGVNGNIYGGSGLSVAGGGISTIGPVACNNTTASTGPTTGALTVAGGLGVGGSIYAAGNMVASGSVYATANVAGNYGLSLENTNAAVNASAFIQFKNDAAKLAYVFLGSSAYATYGGANALNLMTDPGAGPIAFLTNGALRGRFDADGGFVVGAPTGGSKGAGNINAVGVYDDNVLLTCFGVEYLKYGKVDLAYWDSIAPNNGHGPARKFVEMVKEFDPRDPRAYIKRMLQDEALPGMPTKGEWKQNQLSLGEMQNKLWLAVELLATAFAGALDRIEALEAKQRELY